MLDDLSHYEYLGNPDYSWELLSLLDGSERKWSRQDISNHYYGKIIGGAAIFDGCVPLLSHVGILLIENEEITLNPDCGQYIRNEKYLRGKIIEKILLSLKDDEIFNEIFCPENLSYDIVYRSIQINNSAFRFKYANFKSLLINFGFLAPHPDPKIRKLVIHSSYRSLFDKRVLPEVKRRKIGIDEFQKSQERKQIYGDEAENYVLAYEKKRLMGHQYHHRIEIISTYDVAAGYDLVSFDSQASKDLDRFIEVKSFSESPGFYWSRNEMNQAKVRRGNYYLYLVDRAKIKNKDYEPIVIQDPYLAVYMSKDWNKTPTVTYVNQITGKLSDLKL